MNRRCIPGWLAAMPLLLVATAAAEPIDLPLADGRPVLAAVNGEPITEDAFMRSLASMHGAAANPQDRRDRQDPTELLRRLINVQLVVQEARNIGLDELPQAQKALESYRKDAVRQILFERQTRDIIVDPKEIEPRYKEEVKEIRVRSVAFGSKETADAFAARLEAGGDFEAAAGELIESGAAEAGDQGEYLKVSELQPQVVEVVASMQAGDVSSPIAIGDKHIVFTVLERRYPDDPEVRQKIEAEAYRRKRVERLEEYLDSLRDKYAKVDDELFDSLDYEATEPGFDKLAEDSRVLAEIEGEEPVLVSELTEAIRREFFHGMEGAIKAKRVNTRKPAQLEKILQRRILMLEARRTDLMQSPEYMALLDEFENGLLFGTFIEKIVEPEIRLSDTEMQEYFEEHADEFSSPELMRIESLAFTAREPAETAMVKLRGGVDFDWMRANADDLADPEQYPDLMDFPRTPVVTTMLPEEVGQAVSGAAVGDYRLYAVADGISYVLRIREVVPPRRQPFQKAKDAIVRRIYQRKRTEAIDEWVEKIRQASEVEMFVTPETFERMLGMRRSREES